ncbi:MAG: hypothetical protein EPO06_05650 [Burkholderiaceae bacterium]|nr:MAG: hypothetical protein EPO06_05650 [Burkholderiaceae bacterium]
MKPALWMCMLLLVTGCEKKIVDAPLQKPAAPTGREETRSLQNIQPIYDTTGIRSKVDQALDQNDKRTENLDQQLDHANKSSE